MFSKFLTAVLFISTLFTLPLPSTHAQPAMLLHTLKLPISVCKPMPITVGNTLAIGSVQGKTKEQFIESLLPLSMTHLQLSFIQASFYRKDPHQTLNLGWGQRFFITPTTHWGYNLFYDQTGHPLHHQWSLGSELRWNTLKLFVNGYYPLSGWQASEQHRGYDERSIQKIDLGIQGYFAKIPWLNASLHYQRNLGTQSSPSSALPCQPLSSRWVIGFNYTPVPLLTVDYRYQTDPRQARHRFGLTMDLRLQTQLTQQFDPNSIVRLRTSRDYQFDRITRQQAINLTYKRLIPPINPTSLVPKSSTLPLSTHLLNASSDKAASTAKPIIKRIELLLEDASMQNDTYGESPVSLFENSPLFSDKTESTLSIYSPSWSSTTPFDCSFKSNEYYLAPDITDSESPRNNLCNDSGFYEDRASASRHIDFE